MGFRFRKSITLVPGVRLNLGTKGLSLSAGPRGASMTFGRNGVYANVGIPGTGISYRTRLDTGAAPSPQPSGDRYLPMTAKVQDDGTILITDLDGRPLPDDMRRAALRQNGPTILDMLERRAEAINRFLRRMLLPHLETPDARGAAVSFLSEAFTLPKPVRPEMEDVGTLSAWFGGRERAEARYQEQLAEYCAALAEWRAAEANHKHRQDAARRQHERWLGGDPEAMSERFEARLFTIEWPRETIVAFQTRSEELLADIDLPEIEDMPRETAKLNRKEVRIDRASRTDTEVRLDYMAHVHSIGFRVAGEAFAAMPTVHSVMVSGYSQRQSRASGNIEDEYLYSVRIPRSQWLSLNFSDLEAIDPVQALERMDLRRDMTKTGVFRPITPFA